MDLQANTSTDCTVITVRESRIDAACAIQFKDRMRELCKDAAERVILDLGKVDFIDSSGLGAIVASMKMLAPERVLELANPSPKVTKVLRLTRMDSVFTIHEDFASVEPLASRLAG